MKSPYNVHLSKNRPQVLSSSMLLSMEEAMTKGAGFAHSTELLTKNVSPEIYRQILNELPPATRALWEAPPLAMTWVPYARTQESMAAVKKVMGEEAACKLYAEVGKQMLFEDMSGIYKVLMRVVSIDFALKKSGSFYAQYTRNQGSLESTRISPTSSVSHYRNLPEVSLINAHFLGGAVAGVTQLAGGKNVRVTEHKLLPGIGLDITVQWD
jgi:hypothetical protein